MKFVRQGYWLEYTSALRNADRKDEIMGEIILGKKTCSRCHLSKARRSSESMQHIPGDEGETLDLDQAQHREQLESCVVSSCHASRKPWLLTGGHAVIVS